MKNEVERAIVGYEKDGLQRAVIEYPLPEIQLEYLRKLFNISDTHTDPAERDMIYCYPINAEQAKALEVFLKKKLDFQKYDFQLETFLIE